MIKMMTEMECLVCGDHEMCNSDKINICHGCDNGVMIPIKLE